MTPKRRTRAPLLRFAPRIVLGLWIVTGLWATLLPRSGRVELDNGIRVDRASLSLHAPLTAGVFVRDPQDPARVRFVTGPEASEGADVVGAHRFWLGTDRIGRDLAVLVANGARTSLLIGTLAAGLALLLGVSVGLVSAGGPRWLDELLMRGVDALLAFPLLLLVLMLDLLFDPGTTALIVLLGATQWMGIARIARAEFQRVRAEPFVTAAKAMGAGPAHVFRHHLLRAARTPILVSGLLLVGDSILLESAVSFLGFGSTAELDSWGRMVDLGRGHLLDAWWISTLPGLAIAMVTASANLLSDELAGSEHRRRVAW